MGLQCYCTKPLKSLVTAKNDNYRTETINGKAVNLRRMPEGCLGEEHYDWNKMWSNESGMLWGIAINNHQVLSIWSDSSLVAPDFPPARTICASCHFTFSSSYKFNTHQGVATLLLFEKPSARASADQSDFKDTNLNIGRSVDENEERNVNSENGKKDNSENKKNIS